MEWSWQLQPCPTVIPHGHNLQPQHLLRGWSGVGTPWAASGNPPGEGTRGCSAAEKAPSTCPARGQELMSWASSLAAKPAAGPHPLSSDELVHLKREKGKENLCSFGSPKLLELLSSCAPRETKDSSASKRISELEYRNWGFKSSLAFDGETREKWGIEADKFSIENYCLRTEVEQLKTLLAAMEHREKLMEKLAPVSATLWLCKSVHCTYPEPWDRGIWYNNGDDETTENADSKCEPRKTERPKIPTSITAKMFSTTSNDRTSP